MAFHLATSWKERDLQVQAVKDKCNAIIDRLSLPKDDVRTLSMIHVRQFCNTLAGVPIKLQQNAETKIYRRLIMSILGLPDVKALKSCLGDLNKNAKTSFVTMVQFGLENCVEQVLDALPGERAFDSFSKSSGRLIRVTGLPDSNRKHERILVPAWIRNTLHAGGLHRKADKTIVIDGEPYVFEKDKIFSCATWSHLMHAFLNGLDIYEEMFCSPQVLAISSIKTA